MKKFLLSMMLCVPVALAAQSNGVAISGLTVNASTVTFNVSWNKDNVPPLWSDSVWVFVDYNNNGVMTRLPITVATASAGTATTIPGNDKGAWVIGNARTNGSFSATVQLLTAEQDVAGACAYASNYPPMGEYVSGTKIVFTGSPPYNLVLQDGNGGTVTQTVYSPYIPACDYILQSFTDATTGAPGIVDISPGGEGCPPTPSGCADGLVDCHGICMSVCSNFTYCDGFTQVSEVPFEGQVPWIKAEALCAAKNSQTGGSPWRLPTPSELLCMCNNKIWLPGNYATVYYWTDEPYCDNNHYLISFYDCSHCNCPDCHGTSDHVKCVR
jgi:hypothetical protein